MSGTNLGKMPILIVSLVIGIVMATTAIVPLVSDYAEAKTFENKGRYYVDTTIEDDVTITMAYDYDNGTRSWYIDDVLLEYDSMPGTPEYVSAPTVAGTDNYVFRADGRCRGLTSWPGNSDYTLTVTDQSITTGQFVGNAPLFVASTTETDYIMRYSPDYDMYILNDSAIIGCGYTSLKISEDSTTDGVISIAGNIDDGVTVTVYNGSYNFTTSNVKLNVEEVNGYNDLYKFQSVTFDATYNDGTNDYVTSCTYSMVVLPAEVTADPDNPAAYKALVKVVPVMAFVALIAAAAFMIYSKRD